MDERTVSKARMSLATGGCPGIRAPARTRRVARWRRRTLSFPHRTRSPRALTPRKVDDGPQLISLTVQYTNPGLACSPDKAQIEVPGSGKRTANVSSRWCEQGPSEAPSSPLLPSRLEARLPNSILSVSLSVESPFLSFSTLASQSRLPSLSRQNHLLPRVDC